MNLLVRGIHKVSTVLVLAIGIAHVAFTFVVFDSLSESAIWFAGAGLSGVFVALLNTALWLRRVPAASRYSVAAANFLFFFWLVAGVTAISGAMRLVVAGAGAAMVVTAPLLGREKSDAGGNPGAATQSDAPSGHR